VAGCMGSANKTALSIFPSDKLYKMVDLLWIEVMISICSCSGMLHGVEPAQLVLKAF